MKRQETDSQGAPDIPARSRESTAPLYERASVRTPRPEQVARTAPGRGWAYRYRVRRTDRSPAWYGAVVTPDGVELSLAFWAGVDSAGRDYLVIKAARTDPPAPETAAQAAQEA